MSSVAPFGSWRASPDVLDRAVARRRRRDLGAWRGTPHWLEDSDDDGAWRLVGWRDGEVAAAHPPRAAVGSRLYGYTAPAWTVDATGAAVVLTASPLAMTSLSSSGQWGATSPLAGVAAGYVRAVGDDLVVLVDTGVVNGRALVRGTLGGELTPVYTTENLVSDLVVDERSDALAWIEWPVGTMAWDAGELVTATSDRDALTVVRRPGPGPCAQPRFLRGQLVIDVEDGEWSRPHVLRGDEFVALDLPRAEYRPDWSLGRTWVAAAGADTLWCAVHESVARLVVQSPGGATTDAVDGPRYVYDVASDGERAYAIGSTSRDPTVVYEWSPPHTAWVPLTAVSSDERCAGEPVVRRTASGVPFVWYWPQGPPTPPGDRPGLVALVHGGPTAYAGLEFSWLVELICRSGFAVACVDHRGSTSYGASYRRALDGHWGEFDVDDVVAVVDDAIASGQVDPRRVVLRGTSAGSLTALVASTRCAASAVVAVGVIADPRRLLAHTSEFDRQYAAQLTGGEAAIAGRDPLARLDELPSRILVIHGEKDEIVPVAMARQFVAAAAGAGRHVTYVELVGEGHSFRAPASTRRAYEAEVAFYGDLDQP